MDEVYNFYDWFWSLSGLFGLLFFFLSDKSIVKKKGIYDPVYYMMIAIIYAAADWLLSFLVFELFFADDWGDTNYLYAQVIRLLLVPVFYFLCKWLLPKIDNRQIRKTSTTTNYHRWAIAMVAFVIADTALGYVMKRYVYGFWYGNSTDSMLGTAAVIVMAGLIAYRVYVRMNRYEVIKGLADRTIQDLETQRAPIIFLRSFVLDKNPIFGKTFDEYICSSFAMHMQPIISLSDPDDFLPTGGSIKIQSRDSDWENAVNTLLVHCRALVFFEGRSESLKTEMTKIRHFNIDHEKVFVATPPQRYRKAAWNKERGASDKYVLNRIWQDFSKSLELVGGLHHLPDTDPGECKIFTFDSNWSASKAEKKTGTEFFDYILKKTVKYEETKCDYKSLAAMLRDNELTMGITDLENRKIKRAIVIIALLTLVMTIILLFSLFFL